MTRLYPASQDVTKVRYDMVLPNIVQYQEFCRHTGNGRHFILHMSLFALESAWTHYSIVKKYWAQQHLQPISKQFSIFIFHIILVIFKLQTISTLAE